MKVCIILNTATEQTGLYIRPRALKACITNPRKSDCILKILGVRKAISYLFLYKLKSMNGPLLYKKVKKIRQCKFEW